MEFNVSSAELLKGLSDVARAIPAKSPISILENFLFTVKDGNLEITASDQELTLRTNISVDAREDGSMAVPAHQMMDLIKALPDQPISFKTTSAQVFPLFSQRICFFIFHLLCVLADTAKQLPVFSVQTSCLSF